MSNELKEACLENCSLSTTKKQFYEVEEEQSTIKINYPKIQIKGVDFIVRPETEPYD